MTPSDHPLADEPFAYFETKVGEVRISHEGRVVTVLRGKDAERLLRRLEGADARTVQLQLAKVTGQFKFGNERQGKRGPKG